MSGGSSCTHDMTVPGPQTIVIPLPAELDVNNSGQIEAALISVLASSPGVVVADGTQTSFCDCSGIVALVSAHCKAAAAGAQMKTVIASSPVLRLLELIGADQILQLYPSLTSAYPAHEVPG
jgi:anti-sigma B factor antagonist